MIFYLSSFLIFFSGLLIGLRMLKTTEWTDRLLGFDLLQILIVAFLLILKTKTGWSWNQDAAWILLLVSFVSTWIVTSLLISVRQNHKTREDFKR